MTERHHDEKRQCADDDEQYHAPRGRHDPGRRVVDEIADARKEFHDHIVDLIPVGDEHSHQRAEVQQHVVKLRDLRGPLHIQQMLGNGQMTRGRDGQKFGDALHQSHDDGGKPGHSIHAPLRKNTDTV